MVRVMDDTPQTWHYGLMARWWAEFNTDGPEIDYFKNLIARFGEPALDAGDGYTGDPASPDSGILVYIARKE